MGASPCDFVRLSCLSASWRHWRTQLILENLETLHGDYARYPTRRDALLDAHLCALNSGRTLDVTHHLRCVYKVVKAWGMDTQTEKNNPKRPKMVAMEEFTDSVLPLK